MPSSRNGRKYLIANYCTAEAAATRPKPSIDVFRLAAGNVRVTVVPLVVAANGAVATTDVMDEELAAGGHAVQVVDPFSATYICEVLTVPVSTKHHAAPKVIVAPWGA